MVFTRPWHVVLLHLEFKPFYTKLLGIYLATVVSVLGANYSAHNPFLTPAECCSSTFCGSRILTDLRANRDADDLGIVDHSPEKNARLVYFNLGEEKDSPGTRAGKGLVVFVAGQCASEPCRLSQFPDGPDASVLQ